MRPRQTNFGDFRPEDCDDFPGVGRDEWGPKAHRPTPENEARRTLLEARGFSLGVLREEAAGDRPRYHRDDADRYREADDEEHRGHTGEEPVEPDAPADELPAPGEWSIEEVTDTRVTWARGGFHLTPPATMPRVTVLEGTTYVDVRKGGNRWYFRVRWEWGRERETSRRGDATLGDARQKAISMAVEAMEAETGEVEETRKHPRHLDASTSLEALAEHAGAEPLDELQADGGQVVEEADDDPLPGEADELPGEFDPEAETVGDGWEGEHLWTTWGYGQTNVDLAQIVDVSDSGKTVITRMAVPEQVGTSKQSYQLAPSGECHGDEFRLHVRSYGDDKPTFRGSYPYIDGDTDKGTRRAGFSWWGPGREHISETASQYGH